MFFDWSFLTSWLGSAVQGLLSVVVQVFQFLFNLIRAAFILLWNALTAVLGFVLNMLGKLLNVLRPLWTHVLRPALQKLLDFYRWLRLKLATILGPVIRLLQKIKRWFDLHIFPVMKRYIDLIQHIRRTLVIFRIFHIKWAQQLDARLAREQAQVTRLFTEVRGWLNRIIDWVNLAEEPIKLMRLFGPTRTLTRAISEFIAAVTGQPLSNFTLDGVGGLFDGLNPLHPEDVQSDVWKTARGEHTWLTDVGNSSRDLYSKLIG